MFDGERVKADAIPLARAETLSNTTVLLLWPRSSARIQGESRCEVCHVLINIAIQMQQLARQAVHFYQTTALQAGPSNNESQGVTRPRFSLDDNLLSLPTCHLYSPHQESYFHSWTERRQLFGCFWLKRSRPLSSPPSSLPQQPPCLSPPSIKYSPSLLLTNLSSTLADAPSVKNGYS